MMIFATDEAADHGALARRWVNERRSSEVCLATVWEAERGAGYEPTTETYRDAVRLALAHAWDEARVPPPLWCGANGWPTGGITSFGARLIDGLAFHVASMYGADAQGWDVMTSDPRYAHRYEPVIRGMPWRSPLTACRVALWVARGDVSISRMEFPFFVDPTLRAVAPGPELRDGDLHLARARRGGRGLLRRRPRRWDIDFSGPRFRRPFGDLTVDAAPVVERPLTLEELVSDVMPSELAPDYTHQIWVHEAAEGAWGSERWGAHEARLAEQPGIEKVLGEDRELIHVYAPTLTADEVLAAARRAAAE
ncbi:hypothetical protein QQX09_02740 [Demequina sp. SYSU T00192]|uniref:Uncharacterized protein n=1 Tax=Demequina litoralis TaxID=3051660 RepID=A0ABT8G6K1_9MICO|nr:hypothetical protein [Demequina sp. SYSU T00192]MDN4474768.1 hypothetical protein [Demequina sp. SYSU T00192]